MPDSLALPTGTVTFLYTDIEGSTKRWEQHPEAMKAAVERHDAILRGAIESHQGVVFRTMGDAFCAAFVLASQALEATLSAQYALHAESWDPQIAPIKVRMGLHTGPGEVRDGDYVGPHLNRLARLLSTGYGGQVLLSQATYTLVCDTLPRGVDMLDLGEHQLRDLERAERVYQLVCDGLPSSFPPLKTENAQPNNLPILTTEFIGREKELESVCELLSMPSVRLLTLTGAGGTGKTRLSLQAGATFLDKFQHGVFWVPLTAISDPALVPGAIADALRITESGGRPVIDNLKDYLRQKELLLIIDNFEQVMGAARIVSELLSAAAQLKVLVTSREVLHIYGEKEFPVPPLLLPDPQRLPPIEDLARYESIRLFVDRAASVKPGFELTAENGAALASICNRLDGLPLAIELAAARIKLLAPQALLSRLDSRLKLLTSGSRDLPARQQTLRGAIDWSYDLLPAPERAFFRRLAVFKGGCTLEAAEAIASGLQPGDAADGLDDPPGIDALDGLESLVDKSLLRHVESHDSDSRYLMLETIAEYASERLMECGELEALRRRHAAYFLEVAERAEAGIQGPSQKSSIQVLVADHDNVRAVLQWSISDQGDKSVGLRMIYALYRFWHIRGHMSEGRRWAAALLSAAPERTQARARALYATGYMAFLNGDPAEACTLLAESVEIAEELNDRLCLAHALFIYGGAKAFGGDPSGGRLLSERGISIFRQLGAEGKPGLNLALLATGVVIFIQGDYAAASGVLEEARQIGTAIGDSYTRAQASTYLGDLARISCDYERAGGLYEESLAAFRAQGGRSDIPSSLHNIGYVALARREYQRAWELFHESLLLQQEIGNQPGVLESLRGFAAVAGAQGNPLKAARLFGAAEALQSEMGAYLWPAERIECE
ncbi:MAG TPA: tetratricopeptide repeat protein, partial [Chloroflexia bacterium]